MPTSKKPLITNRNQRKQLRALGMEPQPYDHSKPGKKKTGRKKSSGSKPMSRKRGY